jgi:hypothetical protein
MNVETTTGNHPESVYHYRERSWGHPRPHRFIALPAACNGAHLRYNGERRYLDFPRQVTIPGPGA